MNCKILIATHKKYDFPKNNLYTPIHVGKALNKHEFGYLTDDTKENISVKNHSFCELTAYYWAWKNNYFANNKYCGFSHYRRYFAGNLKFKNFSILSKEEIENILNNYDIIVPKKRKYYIETIRSHYKNAHYIKDLNLLEEIIKNIYPKYLNDFYSVMNKKSLHLYNMFIMNTDLYNKYCLWLFTLLFELEKKINILEYDKYQSRVFGFLSERLFNVWILHNKLKFKEISIVNIEKENIFLKSIFMIKRKFYKKNSANL